MLAVVLAVSPVSAAERPNVVIFFSDDQGYGDLGCFGAKDIETPNLDALARSGLRFTDFYSAAPFCSPSRAALMTGRYPIRAGVPGNVRSREGSVGMPASEVTVAELAKSVGYRTGVFGKWHLGSTDATRPNAKGFDDFFGHHAGCIDYLTHNFIWSKSAHHCLWRNRTEVFEAGTYFTDLIAREASRFIDENHDRPFLLYVPFNAPHYPMQAARRFFEKYKHLPKQRQQYAALVGHMDEAVGTIMSKLKAHGLTDKTLVLFMSDNGHSVEARAHGGGGSAGPFKGHKFSLFEGGIRSPFIVSWPGRLAAGEVRSQVGIAMDILPTIAEAIGAKLPADRKIDGRSLWPRLESADAPSPHEAVFWHFGRSFAVRKGQWKLVVEVPRGKENKGKPEQVFLSNIQDDPGEANNLADANPNVVRTLRASHNAWLADVRGR